MAIPKDKKKAVMGKFQKNPADTGSAAVQISLLTERIKEISGHLKTHKKDYAGERGLLLLVGQRRRLLRYLKEGNFSQYQKVIADIEAGK